MRGLFTASAALENILIGKNSIENKVMIMEGLLLPQARLGLTRTSNFFPALTKMLMLHHAPCGFSCDSEQKIHTQTRIG